MEKRRLLPFLGLLLLLIATILISMELALERDRVMVPHLVGATVPLAMERLREQRLQGKVTGEDYDARFPKGAVIRQDPPPGSWTRAGRWVSLTVGRGSDTLFLPDFAGLPRGKVQALLGANGLVLEGVSQVHSARVPKGVVIAQSPPPGTKLRIGAQVSLLVSLGPTEPVFLMPELVGKEGRYAVQTLKAWGMRVETSSRRDAGGGSARVLAQRPVAGSPISPGETIWLELGQRGP